MPRSGCEDYSDVYLSRASRLLDQRWKLILKLHKRLAVTSHSVKFVTRKVSEVCFTREQRRFINRPTLIKAFEPYKNVRTQLLNSVYDAFDPLGRGGIDWRVMIFMLHVILKPTLSPCDHIIDSFRFLTGSLIDVDSPCDTRLKLRDIEQIFQPLIRPNRMSSLVEVFNEIWVNEIAMKDADITVQVTATNDVAMTFQVFSIVVAQMKGMLEDDLEHYYPASLLKFRRLTRIMKDMIEKLSAKAIEAGFSTWRDITLRRRRISTSLSRIVGQTHNNLLASAFHQVKVAAIKVVALSEIQRVWRGHSGRMKAREKIHEIFSAIRIQAFFRGILANNNICTLIKRRKWASTEIQRLVRGYFKGRKIARNRNLTKIDEQRIQDAKMLEIRQLFVAIRSAKKLQRKFRADQAKKKYNDEISKRRRELEVEHAMKQRYDSMKKDQEIHNKRVAIHYHDQKNRLEEDKERCRILHEQHEEAYRLRRQLADELRSKQVEEMNRRDLEYRQFLREQHMNEWKIKVDERCRSYSLYCKGCLKNPETREERQFRKKLRLEIKNMMRSVLERADADKVMMELDEARDIAEEQVIAELVQDERKKVIEEMENDLRRLMVSLDKEAKTKKDRRMKRQQEKANWVLCAAVRRWQARKQLKALCTERYEKIFDDRYKAFYYRNKKTGELSWKRPLQSFDIPAVDDKWEEQLN